MKYTCIKILFFSFISLIAACGGGGDSSPPSGLTVSQSSIEFTATEGASVPAGVTIDLAFTTTNALYAGAAYPEGVSPVSWLSISEPPPATQPYPFTFTVNTTDLTPGTYSTTIGLGIGDNSGIIDSRLISITYTVLAKPAVSVTAINFLSGDGATPTSKTLSISADANATGWDSTVDYTSGTSGWLTLSQDSGTELPATITLDAVTMPVGNYSADVTLSVNGYDLVIPVTFLVQANSVNFISPNVGYSSVSDTAIIRGYGFSTLTSPAVTFGATAASSTSIISDTEIRATYPQLAQGTYSVGVSDATVTLDSQASLVITDPPAFPASVIPRVNATSRGVNNGNLIYDAERQSVYLLDIDLVVGTGGGYSDQVESYTWNGATWDSNFIAFTGSHNLQSRIALSPNGSEILKSGWNGITHIDTDTLTETKTVSAFESLGGSISLSMQTLIMTNDGGAIGPYISPSPSTLYRYDILSGSFSPLNTPTSFSNHHMAAPVDGSKLVISTTNGIEEPVYEYNASSGIVETLSLPLRNTSIASINRDGSRFALTQFHRSNAEITHVYDESYTSLGQLPILDAMAITPDGNKAYTYNINTLTVHVFDLNGTKTQDVFDETGTGTVLTDAPGNGVAMKVTPDGSMLILAGSDNVIVMPAP